MRVAVVGAGAIGTVLAAAGCDAGHEVTVCARTPVAELRLERAGAVRVLPATIVTEPSQLAEGGPVEVVWLTTKAADTAGAARWFDRLCGPDTLVAAAQNGLDQEARVAPYLTDGWVVPALAYIAAERTNPGHVVHLAGDRIVVPTGDAEARLAAAVAGPDGGLVVRGVNDMWQASWRKLLGNLVANPITALTMRRIDVMDDPGIADLARGLLVEGVAVARAEGAMLGEDDIQAVLAGTGQYGPRTGSSMLYDRLAGLPLEHQYLTGEVVRRAETHGIPVPLNSAVLALLDAIDRGGRRS
jgi:2-dehydropantoate 2-reductase